MQTSSWKVLAAAIPTLGWPPWEPEGRPRRRDQCERLAKQKATKASSKAFFFGQLEAADGELADEVIDEIALNHALNGRFGRYGVTLIVMPVYLIDPLIATVA